jgi:hypothetical protein
MQNETRSGPAAPPVAAKDESRKESLTDLIDRLDRESFQRMLELRHVRVLPHASPRR